MRYTMAPMQLCGEPFCLLNYPALRVQLQFRNAPARRGSDYEYDSFTVMQVSFLGIRFEAIRAHSEGGFLPDSFGYRIRYFVERGPVMSNPINNRNDRLIQFLQATPEQQAAIDRILEGKVQARVEVSSGPILLGMGAAAKFLGVSRATLWRMIQVGRLQKVELLPGSFRVRRADLDAIAAGKGV